jgi:hypothetical protein
LQLIDELKRRNVFRAAIAYLAFGWLLVQISDTVFPAFGLGETALRLVIIAVIVGFAPVLGIAWAFEFTKQGIQREGS